MDKNKKIFKEAEELIKEFSSDAHDGLNEEGVKEIGKNTVKMR